MATKRTRAVIVTSRTRDLYYGLTEDSDAAITKTGAIRLTAMRHIAYWVGDKGGITSLAETGPKAQSRIGKACPGGLVTNVAKVLDCSQEASDAFDACQC